MGYIDAAQLERLAAPLAKNGYGEYLLRMLNERRSSRRRDEGHRRHALPDVLIARAEGVRRRARLLLRELQRAASSRSDRARREFRAGQPLALGAQRAARPALPDARSRRASWCACVTGEVLRRGGRPAPRRRRPSASGSASSSAPRTSASCGCRPASRTGFWCAASSRISCTRRPTTGSPEHERSVALERSRRWRSQWPFAGEPLLAAKDRAAPLLAAGGRLCRECASLSPAHGQVGWELERVLQPLGELVAVDRAELDLDQPATVASELDRMRPT